MATNSNKKQSADESKIAKQGELQVVTFQVGNATLALEISAVQEINRDLPITRVPHAPSFVRGVTNLRGEVVTIFDLHAVLGMADNLRSTSNRNLIVKDDGELIGLSVESVSDIMTISKELSPPPSNLQGVPRKLIRGVHQAPGRLVMILDLCEALQSCTANETA